VIIWEEPDAVAADFAAAVVEWADWAEAEPEVGA